MDWQRNVHRSILGLMRITSLNVTPGHARPTSTESKHPALCDEPAIVAIGENGNWISKRAEKVEKPLIGIIDARCLKFGEQGLWIWSGEPRYSFALKIK